MADVLTAQEIDEFVSRGYVIVRRAFEPDAAKPVVDFIWQQLAEIGVLREDRHTWVKNRVYLEQLFNGPIFEACATSRLIGATERLLGAGRWQDGWKREHWGHWAINFHKGIGKKWDIPKSGWHWDGMFFRHFLNSSDQGLVQLCLFTDVASQAGGTLIAEGSHKIVAKFLSQFPEGLEREEAIQRCKQGHSWLANLTGQGPLISNTPVLDEGYHPISSQNRVDRFMCETYVDDGGNDLRVVEVIGEAGDVVLCHPFLFHAPSYNLSGEPRILCNRKTPLVSPMIFDRADGNESPIEISIRHAIQTI